MTSGMIAVLIVLIVALAVVGMAVVISQPRRNRELASVRSELAALQEVVGQHTEATQRSLRGIESALEESLSLLKSVE